MIRVSLIMSLIKPTIEENGMTRQKIYSELSATESIQVDCDVKATNIILQGLPPEVYAVVSNHKVRSQELCSKEFYFYADYLHEKHERECMLYDEFDRKFVTDVKLVRDLHTTNIDQLHAYLGQHEFHANEVHVMHERNSAPLALVAFPFM
ncbi:hypothetical protein Tco_1311941 [Tanacetum coccineum]